MMLRPRWPSAGPIGGEGFAAPAGTCNLTDPATFFAITHSCWWCGSRRLAAASPPTCSDVTSLQLLHLPKFQLDRRRPTENTHGDFHPRTGVVDLLHRAIERGERPIRDAHLLS